MPRGEIVPVVEAMDVPVADEQPERGARRRARYEEVVTLRAAGASCHVIESAGDPINGAESSALYGADDK